MTDSYLDHLDAQRIGYKAGLVPFMCEWHQSFDIPPVPYSSPGKKRSDFVEAVRARLDNRFLSSYFIEVSISLQLETQKVMESDAYGNLDNYSKSINDALKGRDGIFIDDCQIYRLNVSFELMSCTAFAVDIKAMMPDEFVLKQGLKLYGMPDGLFYPQAMAVRQDGRVDPLDTFNTFAGLVIWETMTRNKRAMRHNLRSAGASKLEAFHLSRPAMPLQLGFHRSRAIASGIQMVEHEDWRSACAEFASADDGRIGEVERTMGEYARTIGDTGEDLCELVAKRR